MGLAAMHNRQSNEAAGFTLVEVLIVVVILGVLAAAVVPQFTTAASASRDSALRENLKHLRTQIMVYQAQHGITPGYPNGNPNATPDQTTFIAQMTQYTNAQGQVSASPTPGFRFGPYLNQMPANPINNDARIRIIGPDESFPHSASGDEGWVYQPSTGAFSANVAGTDAQGVAYMDY